MTTGTKRAPSLEARLALVLGALFAVFYLWQTPALWRGPVSADELDSYLASMQQTLNQPEAQKAEFLARLRSWMASDDGQPVLLLNLMRFRDRLGELPAQLPGASSPAQANEYYEERVAPLAVARGEYPLIGAGVQAGSLTPSQASEQSWDRVVVMRAPSRRAFLQFMADPDYGPLVPYKLASTDVQLIPLGAGMVVPDLRWVVGGLLLIGYLSLGWYRCARRESECHRCLAEFHP